MTKQELQTEIESKVLKVISTTEEPDAAKNAAGVKQYITNVLEQDGDKVKGRNIGWYTVDEGQAGEAAFYRDIVVPKSVVRDALVNYMDSLVPATYIRYSILSVNEENLSAEVSVVKDNGDNTATKKTIFVYKNGGSPITHIELT